MEGDIFTSVETGRDWRLGVTPDEMREVDRLAERGYGLTPSLLMEVAGLATARVARSLLRAPLAGRAVSILAGPGNNGGDGLVAARRLAGWGAAVSVLTSFDPGSGGAIAELQVRTLSAAGIEVRGWQGELAPADLAIDALLGFGAKGAPRGNIAEMIDALGASGVRVLSVDLPSGLDAGTGVAPGGCVKAEATVTLALAKTGLLAHGAGPFVGALHLADIGIPRRLWREMGIDPAGLYDAGDVLDPDGNPVL